MSQLKDRPEPVEDFLLNFLLKHGMFKTMQCFQLEWYEKRNQTASTDTMPDVYQQNESLLSQVKELTLSNQRLEKSAEQAKGKFGKLQKERDFHRMNHRRTVQEKAKLEQQLKRVTALYDEASTDLQEMKHKREAALREKMLTRIDRDKTKAEAEQLKSTMRTTDLTGIMSGTAAAPSKAIQTLRDAPTVHSQFKPTLRAPGAQLATQRLNDTCAMAATLPRPSQLTMPEGVKVMSADRVRGLTAVNTIKASALAIASMALNSATEVLVTVDDGGLLSVWQLPGGQPELQVAAHKSWIGGVAYSGDAHMIVTCGADASVKTWDSTTLRCTQTFTEHGHGVWACDLHHTNDFVVSGSMDNTIKVWDLLQQKCAHTIRTHKDAVTAVRFQVCLFVWMWVCVCCLFLLWVLFFCGCLMMIITVFICLFAHTGTTHKALTCNL
eukprot:m.56291 g.56291  ORF g.56291 m.56291 type:complete len:439 (+) comp11553_c0_seq1:223-1539(+)